MDNRVWNIHYKTLRNLQTKTHRYLFHNFDFEQRLVGIIGPRGVGKTTMMLQIIKEKIPKNSKAIYISLDHIMFSTLKIYDLVEELADKDGVKYFFLDEVHKYPNWDQEFKNLYDCFPEINIIFSGSSSINLAHGKYDLSRRGLTFPMHGLSFREFLNLKLKLDLPTLSLDELLDLDYDKISQITEIPRLKGLFEEYLDQGYYPIVFDDKHHFHQRILNIINKTIFEDISTFYHLKTANIHAFKRILCFLATITPGEFSYNSVAKHIGLDTKTIMEYLTMLEDTELITRIHLNIGGNHNLKKIEKVYLNNPNLYYSITEEIGHPLCKGTLRELFFLRMFQNIGTKVFYSKIGDFEVKGHTFEVGGRSKTRKQLKLRPDDSFLVKDDIIYGSSRTIPLYLFGFLY